LTNANNLPVFFASQESPFNLRAFLYHYFIQYWYLYLIFPFLGYGAAWLYLRYAIPEYEVKCSLLIKESDKGSGLSETAILKELGAIQETKNVDNEIQILKSRTLMEEVVRDLNVNVKYFAVGRVKNEEVYKGFYIHLDSFRLQKRSATLSFQYLNDTTFEVLSGDKKEIYQFGHWFETPHGAFVISRDKGIKILDQGKAIIQIENISNLARNYSNGLIVKPMSFYSSVLELKLRETISLRAADILNKLVEVYNNAALEDKNKVSENTISFIDQRLKYLTTELSDVEGGVQQYKQRNQIATTFESGVGIVLDEMSAFDKTIADQEVQYTILENMEAFLRNMTGGRYQLVPANLNTNDDGLNNLLNRFNESMLDRDRLMQTAKSDNPALVALNQELQSLHGTVLETIRKEMIQTEIVLQQAKIKKTELTGKVRAVPRMERELQEIMRQQSIKQNLYLYLLQKREETHLALASTTANSRLVDPARPSDKQVKPQRRLIFMLSILFSLLLPMLIVILRDLLNDTVESEDDIKKVCDVPILGGIALSQSGKNIVVSATSRSSVAEMFRLLRTNLQFMLPTNKIPSGQTILITSSASGDGKTFLTANLGMALAISGKKTVLVELDLRKPKLSKYIGISSAESGITNYLLGQAKVEDIVRKSQLNDNLYVVSSGPLPPNPAELVLLVELDQLMEKLSETFDFILIDTPPVGMVADALLLNRFATASLYVVRQGETKKGMLKLLADIYEQQKLTKFATVLNGIKRSQQYNYSNKYGYGYGYNYYEEDVTGRKNVWRSIKTQIGKLIRKSR